MTLSWQAAASVVKVDGREAPKVIRSLDFKSDGARARVAVALLDTNDRTRANARRSCGDLLAWLMRSVGMDNDYPWQLERTASGLPVLNVDGDRGTYCVSLSHSQHAVAVGITESGSIGVDVESIRPLPRMAKIARFLGWPAHENPEEFWFRWTVAEAFAKCGGVSILAINPPSAITLSTSYEPGKLFGDDDATALCERIEPSLVLAVVLGPGRFEYRPSTNDMPAAWNPRYQEH